MKKGFTLIELIVTIGLIVLLGMVIVSNLGSNLSNQQEKQYELFKERLEKAACVYIDRPSQKEIKKSCKQTHSCNISVGSLLSDGLVEESDLIDPLTKESISQSKNILITYTNGVKDCVYQE